jgi:hypothetical protein
MSKTLINKESGYFAIFIDTEGNRLALQRVDHGITHQRMGEILRLILAAAPRRRP